MCCIIEPCYFGKLNKDSVCIYLFINSDNTTACLNKKAIIEYSGSGCVYMRSTTKELYKEHIEFYKINKRKQKIKENQNSEKNI